MKKLYCKECGEYLGIVRDGNLHKNINMCVCWGCNERMKDRIQTLEDSLKLYKSNENINPFINMFRGLQ